MRTALKQAVSEAVGTAALVFVGLASIAIFLGDEIAAISVLPHLLRLLLVLLGFGAVITAVILSPVGSISGAHINPAVSLAFALRGDLPWKNLPLVISGQLLGGWLGAQAAVAIWHRTLAGLSFGVTHHNAQFPLWASIIVELGGTLLLVWLIFWLLATGKRREVIAVAVGGYIWLFGWATATISGASFNPARSLGPAIAGHDYRELWLYILFPLAGAAIAAMWCRIAPASCGCRIQEGCR
ncbi:aquaporin [bacterium]|nr:aquaporin [bacterium]